VVGRQAPIFEIFPNRHIFLDFFFIFKYKKEKRALESLHKEKVYYHKSLIFLLQLQNRVSSLPELLKSFVLPPSAVLEAVFTFFSYISSFVFFHLIEIANMDKKSY